VGMVEKGDGAAKEWREVKGKAIGDPGKKRRFAIGKCARAQLFGGGIVLMKRVKREVECDRLWEGAHGKRWGGEDRNISNGKIESC